MQVTALIPAYKPKYLIELLTALRYQTVKPARVIISDDSPDQGFVAQLQSESLRAAVADLNVEVYPGGRDGAYNNFRRLLKRFAGGTELFHLWLDDDIPYPRFYERHVQAHLACDTACVVTRRWTAMESGLPVGDLAVPAAIQDLDKRMVTLDAGYLFNETVGRGSNWLGEFSNATFRADMVDALDGATLAGIDFTGLEDIGGFLLAVSRSPLVFVNEYLGYFRRSAGQASSQTTGRPMKLALLAWLPLAIAARRLGQISEPVCRHVLASYGSLMQTRHPDDPELAEINALMPALAMGNPEAEARFLALWHVYSGAARRTSTADLHLA
jgi:hypothetical protein